VADAQRALERKALDAADMGQRLTDRLLTFARRQTLAPERTSLNEIVLSLTEMLRRTLWPRIELSTSLSRSQLWRASRPSVHRSHHAGRVSGLDLCETVRTRCGCS
jgi:hypothetical protein